MVYISPLWLHRSTSSGRIAAHCNRRCAFLPGPETNGQHTIITHRFIYFQKWSCQEEYADIDVFKRVNELQRFVMLFAIQWALPWELHHQIDYIYSIIYHEFWPFFIAATKITKAILNLVLTGPILLIHATADMQIQGKNCTTCSHTSLHEWASKSSYSLFDNTIVIILWSSFTTLYFNMFKTTLIIRPHNSVPKWNLVRINL